MKKLFLLSFLLLLIPFTEAGDINVRLISIDPSPVTPGNFFSITFEATNTRNDSINDIAFELNVPPDFDIETDERIEFNELGPDEEVILSWLVKADNDVKAGFEKIELTIEEEDEESSLFFPVQIQSLEPTLLITKVSTDPLQVAPGQNLFLTIELENQASFSFTNINIKLDLTTTPFAPVQESDEQSIEQLNSRSKQLKTFQIIATPESQAGIYKIPINLIYYDEFGIRYTNENLLSIKVGSEPQLAINQESSSLILNQKGEASIKFVNNGLTKIKLLTITLEPINVQLLSPETIYIGDLESDDFQTIDVSLYPESTGSLMIIHLNYRDANNENFQETIRIPLKVYTLEEAKSIGLIKKNTAIFYFVGAMLLIILYIFFRKRRKK